MPPPGAVFGPHASDDDVYEGSGCRDIVDSACQGCNGARKRCVFDDVMLVVQMHSGHQLSTASPQPYRPRLLQPRLLLAFVVPCPSPEHGHKCHRPCRVSVCAGTTLLYGQAGSGKTHTHEAITRAAVATIFGPVLESSGRELAAFGVSVVEIGGNEHIRCLLSGGDVTLRQGHRGEGVVLEGAREQVGLEAAPACLH